MIITRTNHCGTGILPAFSGRRTTKPTAHGFTVLEMVVVIAVIAILVAILLPVLAVARRKGKETATSGMMTNLFLALEHYRSDWGAYPILTGHAGNTSDVPGSPASYFDPGYFQTPCVAVGTRAPMLPVAIPPQSAYATWTSGENGPLIQLLLNTQCLDVNKGKLVNGRMLDYFNSPLIVRFLIIPSGTMLQNGTTVPEKLTQKVYIWSFGYDMKNNVPATTPNYKNLGLPNYDLIESQNLENNIPDTGDDILSWVQK